MEKKHRRLLLAGAGLLAAFALWTVLICLVDVRAIGPQESRVGFAALNGYIHNLTGVNMMLYVITDWLGLVPIGIAFGFSMLGLAQWIKRGGLGKVDRSILVLGGFYLVVLALYVFFEIVVINYRPTLIAGCLEASYPSSTTMLVMCIMPTAMMQLYTRIQNIIFRQWILLIMAMFVVVMVIGRLLSGVHWITDIVGGALLSAAMVFLYYAISELVTKNGETHTPF